jgi:glutathione synthase/RimK-type ligase-like ATP-grasp enzyme
VNLNSFNLPEQSIQFAFDEWQQLLQGIYDLLSNKLWVSKPDLLAWCARKVNQIKVAQSLGFAVPDTIFTNHVPHLRNAFDYWGGEAIAKPIGRGWIIEEERVKYILTNKLTPENFNDNVALNVAPVTSQKYIDKAYELRVTVVGRKLFAVKIDSQRSDTSRIDWRRYDMANTPYTPYELPLSIEHLCQKIMDYYQLNYAAIDMIKTPEGDYVFLEINGNGQFLWIEDATEIDISGELAILLTNGKV